MKVLLINSYAGSLLVAAKQEGHEVVASLEDKGYGIGCQRLNYPDVTYVAKPPWPELDLRDVVCLAHPPCSCFSMQSAAASHKTRGTDSEAFKCSKMAIEHALQGQVKALAVESVPSTLEGARTYHDGVAERYGYYLYRILLNAITFGVPQWRPRFWAMFVRKDAAHEKIWVHHSPTYRTVGEVLNDVVPGAPVQGLQRYYEKCRAKFKELGFSLEELLEQEVFDNVAWLAAHKLGWTEGETNKSKVEYRFVQQYGFPTSFSASWIYKMNLGGFTKTLMSDSNWCLGARPITIPEYCALAGFPTDYKFDKPNDARAYLSRGVAPPVARWILQTLQHHLEGTFDPNQVQQVTDYYNQIGPGEVADLRVSKKTLAQKKLFELNRKEGR